MAAARERGWWYPYIFMGSLGVVAIVNGILAYFATSTFNGLVTDNAYEKGNNYNATLAMARQQAQLGWTADVGMTPVGGGHKAALTVRYADKAGKPVDGLTVQAMAQRPTVTGYDATISFAATGNGTYVAQAELPLGGEWDFDLVATGDGAVHQVQRRFIIP